jgi:hypothetical protein
MLALALLISHRPSLPDIYILFALKKTNRPLQGGKQGKKVLARGGKSSQGKGHIKIVCTFLCSVQSKVPKEKAHSSLACGSPRKNHKHGVVTNSCPTYRASNK